MPFFKLTKIFDWFFFSRYDCWYHVLSMPVWLPIGNYYFIGPRYFTDVRVFGWGTLAEGILYWFSVFTFTQVIRRIFRRYPHIHQTPVRTAVILLVLGGLMVVQATGYVYIFSLFPLFGAPFRWETVRYIMVIGSCFNVFFCIVLSGAYLYKQWQENQQEREQLKRSALQHQFDQLRGQINPDFLFSSLGSLSHLIGQDTARAEQFVDELAKVYRYLLKAKGQPLVTLDEELAFTRTYSSLLQIRFGAGVVVSISEPPAAETYALPPLTMQLLLDEALKQYAPAAGQPLHIHFSVADGQLQMTHPAPGPEEDLPPMTSLAHGPLPGAGEIPVRFRQGLRTVRVPLTAAATPIAIH